MPNSGDLFSDDRVEFNPQNSDDERKKYGMNLNMNHNNFSEDDYCDYGQLEAAAPAPATDAGVRSPPAPDPAAVGELAGS